MHTVQAAKRPESFDIPLKKKYKGHTQGRSIETPMTCSKLPIMEEATMITISKYVKEESFSLVSRGRKDERDGDTWQEQKRKMREEHAGFATTEDEPKNCTSEAWSGVLYLPLTFKGSHV